MATTFQATKDLRFGRVVVMEGEVFEVELLASTVVEVRVHGIVSTITPVALAGWMDHVRSPDQQADSSPVIPKASRKLPKKSSKTIYEVILES
jgi:hypothetical protein